MGHQPKHFIREATFTIDEVMSWLLNCLEVAPKHNSGRLLKAKTYLAGKRVKYTSKRLRTFLRSGVRCVYCGQTATHFALERPANGPLNLEAWHLNCYIRREDGSELMMTVDHLVPQCRGGSNQPDNLLPACSRCNAAKNGKLPTGKWEPRYLSTIEGEN